MCERIRHLREDGDFKQKELAEYGSAAQPAYSNCELGMFNILIPVLLQLAKVRFFYKIKRKLPEEARGPEAAPDAGVYKI